MPNHYQNRLVLQGTPEQNKALKDFCRGEDGGMDFDNIIPTPQCIKDVGEPSTKITDVVEKMRNVPFSDHPLLAAMQQHRRQNTSIDTSSWTQEERDQLNASLRAYDETGYMYWRDWNIQHWGTKWNAYGLKDDGFENEIRYETANGDSSIVIQELSKKFPETELQLIWASEDIGQNCGRMRYKAGEILEAYIPKGGTKEAYELALELHPEYKEDLVLVGDTYQWKDDE